MSLFGKKKDTQQDNSAPAPAAGNITDTSKLARVALDSIKDGVLIIDGQNCIKLINPAALTLIGELDVDLVLGMDAGLSLHLEDENGAQIPDETNPVLHALKTNQPFDSRDYTLLSKENNQKFPVEISVIPTGTPDSDRIVTFRDISQEKNEGNAQFEFISTASHEMRTPVASIEGYLGLALNPQTATIDDRARSYLEAAHKSSQHLGKLFQDLLDVTKMDDQKDKPHFIPIELTSFVQQLTDNLVEKAREKNLSLTFGPKDVQPGASKTLTQALYVYIDQRYLNEVVSNLIENAIKYTPEGKNIWVNVTSDNNRAIISVEDSGIGISGTDQQHIFQKFYRADNSQTREIGGTGLGLYLVKQRVDALQGSVWVDSIYGRGSTFYVAFPRLTPEEFEKRKIQFDNESQMMKDEQMKEYQEVSSPISQPQTQVQQSPNQTIAQQPVQQVFNSDLQSTSPSIENNNTQVNPQTNIQQINQVNNQTLNQQLPVRPIIQSSPTNNAQQQIVQQNVQQTAQQMPIQQQVPTMQDNQNILQ